MKTRIIKSLGVLFLSILMVTAVNAQSNRQGGRGQGPGVAGEGPAYGMHYKLDLTEEQQTEITALRTEHFKAITPLRNKMAELKARERTLLSEENVDMKAVNKSIDEQTELASSIRKLQVKQQVAIKGLLSDEQLMKMQDRRQFAQRNGFHGKGGQKYGQRDCQRYDQRDSQRDGQRYDRRGPGEGRGYRGI